MNNNDIEEDIEKLERVIKLAKQTGLDKTLANAIENILADRERLEKENNIYREEYQKITKALDFKEGTLNPEPSIAIEAIKKALIQGQAKANKYDRLVERIKKKKKYFEECQELIANSNENYSDGTVIERVIDLLQKLIEEE